MVASCYLCVANQKGNAERRTSETHRIFVIYIRDAIDYPTHGRRIVVTVVVAVAVVTVAVQLTAAAVTHIGGVAVATSVTDSMTRSELLQLW